MSIPFDPGFGRDAPARPVAAPAPSARDADARRRLGFWWAAVSFAGAMAVVGAAKPSIALAAALIVALAVAAGAVAYLATALFRRLQSQPRSEFAPAVHQPTAQVLPHHIARIVPDPADKNPLLTSGARAGLVTVATERLWARHGLNLHDPTHHDRIEQVVAGDLWNAIRPDRVDQRGNLVPRPRFLHRDLDRLLDDLESI